MDDSKRKKTKDLDVLPADELVDNLKKLSIEIESAVEIISPDGVIKNPNNKTTDHE